MALGLVQYRAWLDALTKKASKLLKRVPKKLVEPIADPFIHESVPFPELTVCKICQLEPVSNFFGICRDCRLRQDSVKRIKPVRKRYRFGSY